MRSEIESLMSQAANLGSLGTAARQQGEEDGRIAEDRNYS